MLVLVFSSFQVVYLITSFIFLPFLFLFLNRKTFICDRQTSDNTCSLLSTRNFKNTHGEIKTYICTHACSWMEYLGMKWNLVDSLHPPMCSNLLFYGFIHLSGFSGWPKESYHNTLARHWQMRSGYCCSCRDETRTVTNAVQLLSIITVTLFIFLCQCVLSVGNFVLKSHWRGLMLNMSICFLSNLNLNVSNFEYPSYLY